jgi:hypothetical protein
MFSVLFGFGVGVEKVRRRLSEGQGLRWYFGKSAQRTRGCRQRGRRDATGINLSMAR